MTTQDYIGISQAVILAITAGIIWYYTSETKKIRQETKRQNDLIQEQLGLMRENHLFNQRREIAENEPVFQWGGRLRGNNETKFDFSNLGGRIENVRIWRDGSTNIRLSPSDIIDNGQEGEITFSGSDLMQKTSVRFIINYQDKSKAWGKKEYVADLSRLSIKPVDTKGLS